LFSHALAGDASDGWWQLTIVSHLAGQPTVTIWMRVGDANYVITRGWQRRGALTFDAGNTADDN